MRKKNVLLLHTDQQRHDSLFCTGNKYAKTPNIDALAADGVLYSRHIVGNPVCSPSRACLLTGMTVMGHGLITNGMTLWRLPDDQHFSDFINNAAIGEYGYKPYEKVPTFADVLFENGYNTAMFGKQGNPEHIGKVSFIIT